MKKLLAALAGTATLLLAGGASAAVVYATDFQNADLGATDASANPARYVATRALGSTDGKFYSLGLGGEITLGFGTTFSGTTQIAVTEVTFGNVSAYGEAVDIFAVMNGNGTLIGRLSNLESQTGGTLTFGGSFDGLRFVDVTRDVFATSPSADGFDIDAVELTSDLAPIPLPASGALILAGLGSLLIARRRRH